MKRSLQGPLQDKRPQKEEEKDISEEANSLKHQL